MQIIAMLSMLVDHVGLVFFSEHTGWRLIGRLAFPLYAYGIVQGYHYTRDVRRYLIRLAVLAVVSQLPFMWGLQTQGINVIATFVICLAVLILFDRFSAWHVRILILLAAVTILEFYPFDYGGYGLLLVLIFRYSMGCWIVVLHTLLNLLYFVSHDWLLQFFSLLSTILIIHGKTMLQSLGKINIPRWAWRTFYPAHMTVIGLCNVLISFFVGAD